MDDLGLIVRRHLFEQAGEVPRYAQELCKVTRSPAGNVVEDLGGCRFVSLIGKSAWND